MFLVTAKARWRPLLAASVMAAVLGGCATLPEDAGFDRVADPVAQRLDKQIIWNRGSEQDQAVDHAVKALLAKPLDADAAVQIALLRSPVLQSRYEDLGLAQADLVQAGLLRNPLFGGVWLTPRDPGVQARDFDLRLDFLDLLVLPLRKQAAHARLRSVQRNLTEAVIAHANQTRRAFVELQALYMQGDIVERRQAAADAALLVAQRLRKAGNITQARLQRFEAMALEAGLNSKRAQIQLQHQRMALGLLMGVDMSDEAIRIGPPLGRIPNQAISTKGLTDQALKANLRLQGLREQLKAYKAQMSEAQWKSLIPDLEVGYAWARETTGEIKDGGLLEWRLPLFDQGQGKRSRASSQIRKALADYEAQRQSVAAQAMGLAMNLAASREELLLIIDRLLPLAGSQADFAQLEYNGMQIDVFDLLRVHGEPLAMRERFIDKLKSYWQLRADLRALRAGANISASASMASDSMASMTNTAASDGGH